MALRKFAPRSHPDDVYPAVFPPVFLQHDGQGLSRPDDHLPDLHPDDAHEQRVLHPAGMIS